MARLAAGETLSAAEAEAAFSIVLDGAATQAQIAAMLTALHLRGETREEFCGALLAMRARMAAIDAPDGAIDVCGTGGDGLATLNISTATAFVVAACGVPVAKHGNRALSSRSGGADVLAELGVNIDVPVEKLASILAECGLVFLFAPNHHPALRHAAGVRRELGFRTLFNLLGPAANPAGVKRQLTGVYDPAWAAPMAEILGALGTQKAWLVHGMGLDELTLAGETEVTEWSNGCLTRFTVTPEMAGLTRAPLDAIKGGGPATNARALHALLRSENGQIAAYRNTVLLNAAAALVVAGVAAGLREGAARAAEALDRGRAYSVLEALRCATNAVKFLPERPAP